METQKITKKQLKQAVALLNEIRYRNRGWELTVDMFKELVVVGPAATMTPWEAVTCATEAYSQFMKGVKVW